MNWGLGIGFVIGAIALATIACSRNGERAERRAAPEPPAPPAPGYREIEVVEPGSIAGVVRWEGPRPELEPMPVRIHQDVCGETQPSRALRIGARGGVADAVVWLADIEEGIAVPREPRTVVTEGCRFAPHVLATTTAAPLVFRNEDGVMHNVRAYRDGATVWDFALPERGSEEQRVLETEGVLRLVCDIHAFQEAWVHAFSHPYFAVTDESGRFRIADVPPGQYVVRVWHEGWRVVGMRSGRPERSKPIVFSRTVSVSHRQETAVDFALSEHAAELAGD